MELMLGSYRIVIERIPFTPFELAHCYDQLAEKWHRLVHNLGFSQAYHHLFQQIVQAGYLANCPPNGRVLDCGIGAGDLSLALAATIPGPLYVDGVDISPKMLIQAEQSLCGVGVRGQFHKDSIERLPFSDQMFDLVMTAHALEHLPDPQLGLREMVRVAKPNASVLIVMTQRSLWGYWIQHRWRIHLAEPSTLTHWMAEAGLGDIQAYRLPVSFWTRNGSMAVVGRKQTSGHPPSGTLPKRITELEQLGQLLLERFMIENNLGGVEI